MNTPEPIRLGPSSAPATWRAARAIARRALLADASIQVGRWAAVGAAAGCSLVLADKLASGRLSELAPWWAWLAAPLVIGAAAGLAIAVARRWTPLRAAARADEALGLKSKLASAVEWTAPAAGVAPGSSASGPSPFTLWAIEQAEQVAAGLEPSKVVPIRPPWTLAAAPALALGGVLLALAMPALPRDPARGLEPARVREARERTAQQIEDIARAVQPPSPVDEPAAQPARPEQIEALEALQRELASGRGDPEQARVQAARQLQTLADQIERESQDQQQNLDAVRRMLAEAAASTPDPSRPGATPGQQAGADDPGKADPARADGSRADLPTPARDLVDALRRGDLAGAADAMRRLDDAATRLSPQERQNVADALEELAQRAQPPQSTTSPSPPTAPAAPTTPSAATPPPPAQQPPPTQPPPPPPPLSTEPPQATAPQTQPPSPSPTQPNPPSQPPPPSPPAQTEQGQPREGQPQHGQPQQGQPQQGQPQQGQPRQGQPQQGQPREGQPQQGQPQQGQPQQGQPREGQPQQGQPQQGQPQQGQPQQGQPMGSQPSSTPPSATPAERIREALRQAAEELRQTPPPPQVPSPEPEPPQTQRPPSQPTQTPSEAQPQPQQGQPQPSPPSAPNQTRGGQPQSENQPQTLPQPQDQPGTRPQPQAQPQPGAEPAPQSEPQPGESPSPPGEGPGQRFDPSALGRAARELERLSDQPIEADRRQHQAERLRELARRLQQQTTPEQQQEIQRLVEQLREPPSDAQGLAGRGTPRGQRPPLPDAAPAREFTGDTTPVDARPRLQTDRPRERVIAEWYSDAPSPRDRGSIESRPAAAPEFRRAAEAAQRAVEQQAVPQRYADVVRRVFERYSRQMAPTDTPAGP